MNHELKDSVIAFLDILGFKNFLENPKDFDNLLTFIKNVKNHNTDKCEVDQGSKGNINEITVKPNITSFSDCMVLSVPLESIKQPFHIGHAVHALFNHIRQLADSLITEGYILRGGIARGDLYHEDGVVFGKPLIDAYQLESSKAKFPRILVSDALSKEYNTKMSNSNVNYLLKEDDEHCFDYLKPVPVAVAEGDVENITARNNKYQEKAEQRIKKQYENILCYLRDRNFAPLSENIKILEKWVYFKNYVENTIQKYK